MVETHTSIIEELPEYELDGYIAEATTKPELKETLEVLQREKNRRQGLLLAATEMDATGVWDANSGDQPTQPIPHATDNVWPQGPRFLHAKPSLDGENVVRSEN